MRAFIKNYLEAEKARREEEGEKGFSLIELIVVVVILGILVAIAIPIFAGLQASAQENALKAAASDGATAVAAQIANAPATATALATAITAELTELSQGDFVVTIDASDSHTTDGLEGICVRAALDSDATNFETAGPGC
ncbi:prepilin-type N-terminal cleavage/methylation domain-containing protein [Microbacterium sp. PRC9]|uniref:prepilin-type N-terminal cleavage/methylation domain-containing protein n=1 Tax=Microbacterium sp. PRC9 TaxID=2962591 RepID=UPI002880BFFF|nr:prepilin-type N-terminal cleavage/methylation domain-containing protein [Microbacterium sp. PRC9]MDT0143887.1 prepilin-type N-terminal cleavage/methylation domain-containing protein [Microbacterium sp. PRC9]